MTRYILLALLSVWMALPVLAQTSANAFTNCGTPASAATAKTSDLVVREGGNLCFDADSGFTAGSESLAFKINAEKATICLNADRNSTGGVAAVDIQVCPGPDAAADNTCMDSGLTLSLSNPCEAVARGRYRFEYTAAATGTQDSQIVVEAY